MRNQENFTMRKSKKYKNLVPVAFGVVVATAIGLGVESNNAYASDVESRTENPATNAVTAQPKPTTESVNSQSKTNQSSGAVEVNFKAPQVDKSVENAQNNGVKVEKTETVDKGVTKNQLELDKVKKEVEEDYNKQEKEINSTTDKYVKDKDTHKKEVEKITVENKQLKDKYNSDVVIYNDKVAEIKKKNAEITATNTKKEEDYKKEVEKITKENADIVKRNQEKKAKYERDLATHTTLRKEQDEEKERLISGKPLLFSKDGLSVYGNFNESGTGSLAYYKDIVVINDTDKTKAVTLKTSLDWHEDTTVDKVTDSLVVDKSYGGKNVGYGNWTKFTNAKTGDKFIIRNIAETTDGKKINAIFTVEFGKSLGVLKADGTPKTEQAFSVASGYDAFSGGGIYFDYQNMRDFKLKIELVDNENKPVKIAYGTVVGDVDWGQGSKLSFENNIGAITPSASTLQEKHGLFYSMNRYDGFMNFQSTPKGTYLTAGIGDKLYYHHSSFDKNLENEFLDELGEKYEDAVVRYRNSTSQDNLFGIAFNLFGKGAELKSFNYTPKPIPPKYETEKPLPDKPVLEKLQVNPPKPVEPEYKVIPKEPKVPVVKYHYNKVNVSPEIIKSVKNTENKDINNSYVSKLSTVKWELTTKPLPSNREITNKYQILDSLPKGFVLDVDKSKQASKDFIFEYKEKSHTVVLNATQKLLDSLNKDLDKEVIAPTPVLIGTVINDGATYKNNFSLNINNKYERYSNTVVVHTPGKPNDPDNPNNNLIKPEKHNYNEKGVLIDGKQVLASSTNFYRLTWDLDQYKNIKATKEDIKKGFFYIDDYPEEALDLLDKTVKITDTDNKEVKDITVSSYESLEKAPQNVKDMLEKAKIKPNGAFQLFTADKPEEFYSKYVVTGKNITIVSPMKVKEELAKTGAEYKNKAYQVDFGNGYETDIVVNNVPKLEPKKDVTVKVNGDSVDGKQITLNSNFNYHLIGAKLPSNRSDEITDYTFYDDYDEKGDKYTGEYKVFATVDIALKDKKVIEKGTDITEHTTQKEEDGKVTIEVKKDLLEKVDNSSEFQADVYLQMVRIAVGTFENTYENTVNGVKLVSNTVKTSTLQPPVPTPKEKVNKGKRLPNTGIAPSGSESTNYGYGIAGLLSLLGMFGFTRKRKN